MSDENIYVRLTYHPDSNDDDRESDYGYLFEKLSELIAECRAFQFYRVLIEEDPDYPTTPG
jgi:hypothetical protein